MIPIMSRTEPVLSITTREDDPDNEQNCACAVHYHQGRDHTRRAIHWTKNQKMA
jgi:hypothetical protein